MVGTNILIRSDEYSLERIETFIQTFKRLFKRNRCLFASGRCINYYSACTVGLNGTGKVKRDVSAIFACPCCPTISRRLPLCPSDLSTECSVQILCDKSNKGNNGTASFNFLIVSFSDPLFQSRVVLTLVLFSYFVSFRHYRKPLRPGLSRRPYYAWEIGARWAGGAIRAKHNCPIIF